MPAALQIEGLTVRLGDFTVLDHVDLQVEAGQFACLLGLSGAGKSLTAATVLGTLPAGARAAGSLRIAGVEVLHVPPGHRPRGTRPAPVFQDASTALHPSVRLGTQVAAAVRTGRSLRGRRVAHRAAVRVLEDVGFDDAAQIARRCPPQLSGGQRQRAALAIALACGAPLVVADEPTSGLDVVAQAHVLGLLARAAQRSAVLLITHDLLAAATVADELHVLHAGRIVETGRTADVLAAPGHQVTRALVNAARDAVAGLP